MEETYTLKEFLEIQFKGIYKKLDDMETAMKNNADRERGCELEVKTRISSTEESIKRIWWILGIGFSIIVTIMGYLFNLVNV